MIVAGRRLTFEASGEHAVAPVHDFLYADRGPTRGGEFVIRLAAHDRATVAVAPGWSVDACGHVVGGDGFAVRFDRHVAEAAFDRDRAGADRQAAQAAAFGALRRMSCADLHAGAVTPPGTSDALILLGPSGHGKSTLTLCAVTAGWGFLSDDVIVAFASDQEVLIAPLRRRLQISEAAVPLLPKAARSSSWSATLPRKLVVDPESEGLPGRKSRARPARLVFLEHGARSDIRPISAARAFERLLLLSPHLAFDPGGRAALDLLKRLVRQAPACVASLPLAALSDVSTLYDLAS